MKTIEFKTKVEDGIIKVPKKYRISNKDVKIAIFEKDISNKEIIYIEFDNQLKSFFSTVSLKKFIEQQLEFLLIDVIKSKIDKKILESGIDNDYMLEKSREQAWENYKDFFLNGVRTD